MNTVISTSEKGIEYVVELGGEQRHCTTDTFDQVCEQLVEKYGGVPSVRKITQEPQNNGFTGGSSNEVGVASGTDRVVRDEQTALDNGFSPKAPLYSIGTKVNEWGVDNARRSQAEYDEKPWAQDVARALYDQVKSERRQDLPPVRVADLRMNVDGKLAMPDGHEVLGGARVVLDHRAFGSLMRYMPCEASGTAYLGCCPPKLRAINFNHWAVELDQREEAKEAAKRSQAVLRTRVSGGQRAVFAAVSPGYTAFDADKIAEALQMALPSDAKGSLDYNGQRFRLESLWHTDVAPDEFVAGEIFKAGVIVRADDTGGGSIRVQSVIWRNLCLNLIILDRNVGVDVRIRHVGSVNRLAGEFRNAFNKALNSVNPFRTAWRRAIDERDQALLERVQGTTADDLSRMPVSQVLPGIFNGILERELVKVPGRNKDVVPQLMEMHSHDERAAEYGVSRASVMNAFTRYAHQVEESPFAADEIREGAGKLLSAKNGKVPAPLPYVALSV